jgi:hypothetical protein
LSFSYCLLLRQTPGDSGLGAEYGWKSGDRQFQTHLHIFNNIPAG